MWNVGIYNTQTGQLELPVQVSAGTWETRITGRGRGNHTIPLHNAGIPQSLTSELTKTNKYTIVQSWGTDVVFAGVIGRADYVQATRTLVIDSTELRAAYMNDRMLFGVPGYLGTSTLLSIVSKSHSGATRAVIDKATGYNSQWAFPIDLPADGSGSFNATWTYDERMKWEDHLSQIEDDGCEIDFRPYRDSGGLLRWEARVADPITSGTPTDLAISAAGSRVVDLHVVKDGTRQMTGVLAFGKGGTSAPTEYAPTTGSGATDIGVRDIMMNFPDIDDTTRLQAAATTNYNILKDATEQWQFGLHVWPDGPQIAAPGRLLNLWSYGDEYIPDGKHAQRVIALSGDMGFKVTPEVQNAP